MAIVVIDVGSTNVKARALDPETRRITADASCPLAENRPASGIVEFDADALASSVFDLLGQLSSTILAPIEAIGITAQRASTIVWDVRSHKAIAPGISWQDLRTVGQCLALQSKGLRLAPNQSATKLAVLLGATDIEAKHLRFSTIDSFIAASLSGFESHITDASNVAVTGLIRTDGTTWDEHVLEVLGIDPVVLPSITDSYGSLGVASAVAGAPPITALIGDQQSSAIGQGCLAPGDAKITFGTGAMLDCLLGANRPAFEFRGEHGCFPIIAWRDTAGLHWGLEAITLSAGSALEWMSRIGIIEAPAQAGALAASVRDSGGVCFVPAFGGIATPQWDFGARASFTGLDSHVGRAELVRAVLEGIAFSAAEMLDAAEADGALRIETLHGDGGMSADETFVQLVANATARPVTVSGNPDGTSLGAGMLAGVGLGLWPDLAHASAKISSGRIVEPTARLDRSRWRAARDQSLANVPALSQLKF